MVNKSNPLLSSRAINTPASPIRSLSPLARIARANKTVYGLNIGQPDLETPPEFFVGLRKFDSKVVAYEISEGNLDVRTNWCKYLKRANNLDVAPEQMLITTGASEALVFSFMVTCDPGAEVIVFEPTYANYMGFAAISGVHLVPVSTTLETGFSLPPIKEVVSKLTANTRAILICNPNNPTGTLYSEEQIKELLELCEDHSLFLIVDETYRDLVFDGRQNRSVLEIAPSSQHVIVIDSLSKRFNLCGARIGCLISANMDFLLKTLSLAQARLASPTIDQLAASYLLANISPDFVQQVCNEYQERRDALHLGLSKIPHVKAFNPHGAFYSILELPVSNATDFIKYMLSDFELNGATVFLAPAAGFYITPNLGLNQVRIAGVIEQDLLTKSAEIIGAGLEQFQIIKK